MNTYSPLHCHSHFSLDGCGTVSQWVDAAKNKGLYGLALTDHGDCSSLMELYYHGKKKNIPVLMGCEFYLVDKFLEDDGKPKQGYYHITVLVKSFEGYKNICKLSTLSFLSDHFYRKPRISIEELFRYSNGLMIASGCLAGPLCKEILRNNNSEAEYYLKNFLNVFKEDYYLELQPSIVKEKEDLFERQEKVNRQLIEWSHKYNVKCIITPDAHIIDSKMKIIQDIKLHSRSAGNWDFDQSHHLFTPQELDEKVQQYHPYLIPYLENLKKVSCEIMDKGQFEMPKFNPLLPEVKIKDHPLYVDGSSNMDFLMKVIFENGRINWSSQEYVNRLKYEINTLFNNGVIDLLPYFLLLEDLVRWCQLNNIIVGPGRGSAAGSLICYALKITHLDPIKYHLSFDRFINEARIKNGTLPDVDLDFSRPDLVKKYVREKYGNDKVAILGTFQTLKAKGAIKDVLSAVRQEMSFLQKNELTKSIRNSQQGEDEMLVFEEALNSDPYLKSFMESNQEDVYYPVIQLLGQSRQRGRHPCAVVISSEPLENIIPLWSDGDEFVTQYSADWCAKVGTVKYDFLGLNTLTDISRCVELIKQTRGISIDPYNLDWNDKTTFDAFSRNDVDTVFQFHTQVAKSIINLLNSVDTLDDLSVITALGRPGPMDVGMHLKYIARKNGTSQIEYPHHSLSEILKDTYGIIVYQEQVMKAFQILGGFTLSEADEVRRAMGKKNLDLLNSFKDRFVQHATSKFSDINKLAADDLWDKIESFARYGFNKSHSMAYGMIGYICQYLKQHYPIEWYCAVFGNGNADDRKELYIQIKDIVLKPDVNASKEYFYIKDSKIQMSLDCVKKMGERSVNEIVSKQPFVDFDDFYKRINKRLVRKDIIEAGIFAGIFKNIEPNLTTKQLLLKFYKLHKIDIPESVMYAGDLDIKKMEMDALPIESMDYYVMMGNKIDRCDSLISYSNFHNFSKSKQEVSIVGLIESVYSKNNKKGEMMAFLKISNQEEKISITVWPKEYEQFSHVLKKDSIVQIYGTVNVWNNQKSVVLSSIKVL